MIRYIPFKIKAWWRRIRGRCQLCGVNAPSVPRFDDVHSQGPFCRPCNKRIVWAQMYGAGPEGIRKILNENRQKK